MSIRSYFRRFGELEWKDRLLLAETTATLAAAAFAIRVFPFRRVMAAVAPLEGNRSQTDPSATCQLIDRTCWAVEACARVLPWKNVCFQKGLALHWLLHRRGVTTSVHYGVAQNSERGLTAHVWVTHWGDAIIGGEEAAAFTCLASFPEQASVTASSHHEVNGIGRGRGEELPRRAIRQGSES